MLNNEYIVTPDNFMQERWVDFFIHKSKYFCEENRLNQKYIDKDFIEISQIGKINIPNSVPSDCGIYSLKVANPLTERSSRKKQFDIARNIITQERVESGIFIFFEENKSFRLSFIYPIYQGKERKYSNYKRNSFFVSKDESNKTYLLQMDKYSMNSFDEIKDMFSIEKVSSLFYEEFQKAFESLKDEVVKYPFEKEIAENLRNDFALLFALRIIFLGFVQKKGWLGNDNNFIKNYIKSYDSSKHSHGIYQDLLTPLFFKALNQPHSQKNKFLFNNIDDAYKDALVNAPYLNGGLFYRMEGFDTKGLYITNEGIHNFVNFLFSYNFTLEENTIYDEELELNPEFLGIIFEKLINKQYGAIYTPQLEVDLMCRLSLVKFLQQNCSADISYENLYKLFFREFGGEEEQTIGDFTYEQGKEILDKLENITICDPAIGSGAFAVGMLNAIFDTEEDIYKNILNEDIITTPFERKKRIIFKSLYGVEIQKWAVWITQLRLWISLFLEADDELKNSDEPLLPSFDFKIRQGDSLIQILGDDLFPISGKGIIGPAIEKKINEIQKLKTDYYYNKRDITRNEIERLQRNLYISMMENRKKELINKLYRLKKDVPNAQIDFLSDKDSSELELAALKREGSINKLELEIKKLDIYISQINNNNIPFIWRIDFPEIFMKSKGFDIVIGNPPYVAQEEISDPQKLMDNRKYKNWLKRMAEQDFPDKIAINSISGKSDLYAFFYIRGLRLLNKKGILTFICSNSWLDVDYGAWLQKFLLDNCQIYLIIDNLNKRVFRESAINTIISIISSPQPGIKDDDLIRFVAFKIPYESSIYTDNFLSIEDAKKRIDLDDLRVNVVTRKQLLEEGRENSDENRYLGSKWGAIYLKAPDIYFTIREKAKNKLVKLGNIAEVKFGVKTGAHKFFYIPKSNPFNIEEEFLKPVIKSPRESKTILINPEKLKYWLFVCPYEKEEIKGTNALKYIESGESYEKYIKQGKDKGKKIKGLQNVSTIKGRKLWWALNQDLKSNLFIQMLFNDTFKILYSDEKIYGDECLYCIKSNYSYLHYILNSSLIFMFIELNGRANYGEGVLGLMVYEAKNLLIPNPDLFTINDFIGFEEFLKTPILPISRELPLNCNRNNLRYQLDCLIFSRIGLDTNLIEPYYRELINLVSSRINKASSFKQKG